jgi:hypothetical protein
MRDPPRWRDAAYFGRSQKRDLPYGCSAIVIPANAGIQERE